jgi:hypothetical protein
MDLYETDEERVPTAHPIPPSEDQSNDLGDVEIEDYEMPECDPYEVDEDEFHAVQRLTFERKDLDMCSTLDAILKRTQYLDRYDPRPPPGNVFMAAVRMTEDEQVTYRKFLSENMDDVFGMIDLDEVPRLEAMMRKVWPKRSKKFRNPVFDTLLLRQLRDLVYALRHYPFVKSRHHTPATKALRKNSKHEKVMAAKKKDTADGMRRR